MVKILQTRPDTRQIDAITGDCSPFNHIMTETQTVSTRKTRDFYDFTNWCETDIHTYGQPNTPTYSDA